MNIERLDTIRAILSEMKQMADEALCAPEPTQSNDLMPLLTEATELEEGYEDVPEQAVPLCICPRYTARAPHLTPKISTPFKPQEIPNNDMRPLVPPEPETWAQLFQKQGRPVEAILQFLGTHGTLVVSRVSSSLRKAATGVLLREALSERKCEALEWETIINYQYVARNFAQTFLCNASNNDQQSEHSRDLDRTFLVEEVDNVDREAMAKLDRVLRALGMSIEYFQSLNYITAAFLSRYDEELSYWCTRFLLHKVRYFQTNLPLLHSHMSLLSSIVEQQLPKVCSHLRNSDLSLEYFADRWLIPLFSYDTDLELMLKLWRLICLSDSHILVCFVLAMLRKMENRILEADEEQLNYLLKFNLKGEIRSLDANELLQESVELYVQHFVGGVSLQHENLDEEVLHNPTTALPVGASPRP